MKMKGNKKKILEAAKKITYKGGLLALSITNISKESKISKSLIMYHFKSVEEIVHSLFFLGGELGKNITQEKLLNAHTTIEKIHAIVDGAYKWTCEYPEYADFLILMYHQANKNEEILKIHKMILNTGFERIKLILFESNLNLEKEKITDLALGIQSLIIGSIIRAISIKDPQELQKSKKALLSTIQCILYP